MAVYQNVSWLLSGLRDASGDPLALGTVTTYTAGTTTPATFYVWDSAAIPTPTFVSTTNPIVLDARGCANVYAPRGTYKFLVKSAAGAEQYTWDQMRFGYGGLRGTVVATSAGQSVFTLPFTADTSLVNTKVIVDGSVQDDSQYTLSATQLTLGAGLAAAIQVGFSIEIIQES